MLHIIIVVVVVVVVVGVGVGVGVGGGGVVVIMGRPYYLCTDISYSKFDRHNFNLSHRCHVCNC
jgi:hypothetical protein